MILMEDGVKKSDCLPMREAAKRLGVSWGTLVTYMREIGVTPRKFRFDGKNYLSNVDAEVIKAWMIENGKWVPPSPEDE